MQQPCEKSRLEPVAPNPGRPEWKAPHAAPPNRGPES